MAISCLLRAVTTGAITTPQFIEVLQRTWLESRRAGLGRVTQALPPKLGLAVSGGADSMALAYLCKQWENHCAQNLDRPNVSITAFVVDHQARPESSLEANTVAQWLMEMGIRTQILELDWLQGKSHGPSNVSAFETHARRLRFQALGKACMANEIGALLMGHHQDDNVETTLWRLCSGARGAGLAGIPPVTRIPECHGLYGVSESGSTIYIQTEDLLGSRSRLTGQGEPKSPGAFKNEDGEQCDNSIPISSGGILICRPLLSFPKTSILATCEANKIPFVSDPTNFDPTLTPRNAIRSLLSTDKLPRALQNPSVLSLVQTSQDLISDSLHLSNNLLEKCNLLDLSLPTGTLTIEFPSSITPETLLSSTTLDHEPKNPSQRLNQIQSLTLRRITELISPFPENHFSLRSFQNFTKHVFPPEDPTKPTPFTLGGIMFQPLPSKPPSPALSPTDPESTKGDKKKEKKNTWRLSRQPFMRHRHPISHFEAEIPAQQHQQHPKLAPIPQEPKYTPWALWDNRYWFRFAVVPVNAQENDNHSPHCNNSTSISTFRLPAAKTHVSLVVRPFLPSDLQIFRRTLEKQEQDQKQKQKQQTQTSGSKRSRLATFLERLDKIAPGQSRFTIPLVTLDGSFAGSGQDLPLALPTVRMWLPREYRPREEDSVNTRLWTIQWEWKYKMIDVEALKLMAITKSICK